MAAMHYFLMAAVHCDSQFSMTEHALSRKDHCDTAFVRGGDHLGVANRSARLDDRSNACFGGLVDTVAEGEIRVRTEDCALGVMPLLLGLVHREKCRVDA